MSNLQRRKLFDGELFDLRDILAIILHAAIHIKLILKQ